MKTAGYGEAGGDVMESGEERRDGRARGFGRRFGVSSFHSAKKRRADMNGTARKIVPGSSAATVTGIQTC